MNTICSNVVTNTLARAFNSDLFQKTWKVLLPTHPDAFEFSTDFLMDGPELRNLAERNNAVIEAVQAVRVASKIKTKAQNALDFVIDATWDKYPDNFPSWNMLEEYFDKIRAMPGSAHAFRYLLKNASQFRGETMIWVKPHADADVLETKVYGMCNLLAQRASAELEDYENVVEGANRPADIYRAYGIALRYATEELGSLVARRALSKLMMASPLPIDELENPDWVDPYTSDLDEDYTYLKVKETAEVSSDGNMPVMIQDLLHNMDDAEAKAFQEVLEARGSSLDDYWLQFREAQRSGYSEVAEPEDDWEEPEFDVIDKEFGFGSDLLVSEATDKIKREMILHGETDINLIAGMKAVVQDTITFSNANYKDIRDARIAQLMKQGISKQLAYYEASDYAGSMVHAHLLKDPRTKAFLRQFQALVWKYSIPDMMSILLPFQNGYCFWEEDLYNIKVPGTFRTLAHWYMINGEEYLEQFITKGDVDYGDKEVNKQIGNRFIPQTEPTPQELDEFAWKTAWTQQELYRASAEKINDWATNNRWGKMFQKYMSDPDTMYQRFMTGEPLHPKGKPFHFFPYKLDASWSPAFIDAEVETAILGEGGSNSAKAAGWDAWRQSIDADANQTYKFERRHGASHAQAMGKFWERVKSNKNRIDKVGSQGLTLRSDRVVSWSIALLKFKANEIPMQDGDYKRLLTHLQKNKWGTSALTAYLTQKTTPVTA